MYRIVIQYAVDKTLAPTALQLRAWAKAALTMQQKTGEVTIRIVDCDEITALNAQYRHKNKPTNVLSFAFETPSDVRFDVPILGDIVICADVVNHEAITQHKSRNAHWAHMVIHGILHLLGYDHETDEEATIMEAIEITRLKALGFPNPYLENQ